MIYFDYCTIINTIIFQSGHGYGKLLSVQLGDETDSKMMLGSYHCTDIPGEFVWQPGVLTKVCHIIGLRIKET